MEQDKDLMHVVMMTQGLDGAIPFYRLRQPLEWCRKKGLLKYTFINLQKEINDISEIISKADVCIWQCQTGWNAYKWLKTMQKSNKIENTRKLDVFEYDDNLFDISPFNKRYNVFGTKEVWFEITDVDLNKYGLVPGSEKAKLYELQKTPNNTWRFKVWKDGQDGMILENNIDRIAGTNAIIKDCGLLTVTTEELAKKLMQHTGRKGPIAILPNLLDFDLWKPQKPNTGDKLRICWAGGDSHYQDWKIVEEALLELQKEIDFTLIIAGQKFEGIHKKFTDVEFLGWHADIRTYPMHMRDLKADIGICPLVGNEFDKGKSSIKWLEYSALKIPTIASNVIPYKVDIKDNKTGLLVNNNTHEWLNAFRRLIKDKELRCKLAEKALADVMANHSIERSIEWYEAYKMMKPSYKKQILLK